MKKSLLTLALVASMSTALVGCGDKSTKSAAKPITVSVQAVQTTDTFRWIDTYGQTEGAQEVEVRAQVSGVLRALHFAEGSQVKAGQTLFEIEKEPYEAALAQAVAQTAQSKTTLETALRDWRRAQKLIKTEAISRQEFDKARSSYLVAKSALLAAEAKEKSARIDLQHALVPAPVDGVIGRSEVNVGALVSSGSTLLTSITQPQSLRVSFAISDSLLKDATLNLNNPVWVSLKGAKKSFPAKLDYIASQVDANRGTLRLRAKLENAENIWAGQYVEVRLMVGELKDVFKIPQAVIRQRPDGTYSVFVYEEGQAKERLITVSHWEGRDWVVTSGLKAGDQVITNQILRLRNQLPVTLKKTDKQ